jgi:nucleotide-binding universal stress UspA family protein
MLPFKKILCPTDFSESSYEAIKTAGEIAFHFGSELCVLHVVSPVPMIPVSAEPSAFDVSLYERELEASSKKSLEEIVNQLEWKELRVRLIVLRGNAADEIVRTAHEENVDLIVIATRGRTGLDRLVFGSVAEKVVRFARCPVLTVASQSSAEAKEETSREEGEEVKTPKEKSERRKAYQEKIEGQLKDWGAKIDELRAKVERSKGEVKLKYEKQMEGLRNRRETVQKKLLEMKESGEEAWEGLKAGIEKGLEDLQDTFDQTVSKFKEKGDEAAGTISKKKKIYIEKAEAELKEWGAKIDVLKAKAEKSKGEIKIKYLEQIQELRNKQEALKKKLRELRESGDEAWEDFKEGMDNALDELKKSLKRAVSRFKKK